MKFKIKYISKKLPGGYIGMNAESYFKIYGKKYPYAKNVILVLKGMSEDLTESTIQHEKIEYELINRENMSYHKAHIISNSLEEV